MTLQDDPKYQQTGDFYDENPEGTLFATTHSLKSKSVEKTPAVKVRCAMVAIPLPVNDPFTYKIPEALMPLVREGARVRIPFKNRFIQGYVVGFMQEDPTRLKAIEEAYDEEPIVDADALWLTKWISERYLCSWGEAIENAVPVLMRKGKIPKRRKLKEIETAPRETQTHQLTEEQGTVWSYLQESIAKGVHEKILLHGVTGSGKSEIYIRSIHATLDQKKSVICLVPEIGLTSQIRHFFADHFGDKLEVIHSRMTDRERWIAWQRLRVQEPRVVLGPRSAVFAPVDRLGLIVCDEEHEGAYKQEETPRYHAREVAAVRCEKQGAILLMGSATPSIESMTKARLGRYKLLQMQQRVDDRPMPKVHLVDLKRLAENRRKISLFTPLLREKIDAALYKKEGVLILLNRRGFARQVQCRVCGGIAECVNCHVALTFHQGMRKMICHYCNYQRLPKETCLDCHAPALKYVGWGTERLEAEMAEIFPRARIARLDADVARRKGAQEDVIDRFRKQEIDILVGTQMIAKGFDFPQVTVVGVLSADLGLALPDYRSSERTFQLLTQVSGRSGRGDKLGEVVIQTFSPDHPSIRYAREHDYMGFYFSEIEKRKDLSYPPYRHLINIMIQGGEEKEAIRVSDELQKALKTALTNIPELEMVGPAPLAFYKLRGHYRWHLLIKAGRLKETGLKIKECLASFRKPTRVRISVDVDPLHIL